jgi:NCS1 family nucleobase:cation symporter-1
VSARSAGVDGRAEGVPAGTVEDATLSELPLLRRERIWGFWDYSSVNVGLAIATWAFLQGGAVAYYVGAKAAIASIVIGYGISVLLVSLAPCLPSARYGIEQFVSLRSVFGHAGARVLMLVLALLLAAAWSAVLAIMCGHALANVSNQVLGTGLSPSSTAVSLLGLLAVAGSWVLVARGPRSIELINRFVAPGLLVITGLMLILVFTKVSWADLAATPALDPWGDSRLDFLLAVELNIAGGFAWWPNVGNLARLTRSSRSAFWPNAIGLFLASVVAAIVGVLAALALGSEDPTMWMVPLGGALLGIIALAFVGMANVTSIVAQTYSALVAVRGGAGERAARVPWPLLAGVLLVPAAVLVFFPATVYDNYARFVSWGAIVLAPLCGVQIVDFFVLRRQRIALRELYRDPAESAYGFWRGVNPVAVVALAAGALTYVLLLDPVTYEPSAWFRYLTASLPAFVVAGSVHYVLTRAVAMPLGWGGYRR